MTKKLSLKFWAIALGIIFPTLIILHFLVFEYPADQCVVENEEACLMKEPLITSDTVQCFEEFDHLDFVSSSPGWVRAKANNVEGYIEANSIRIIIVPPYIRYLPLAVPIILLFSIAFWIWSRLRRKIENVLLPTAFNDFNVSKGYFNRGEYIDSKYYLIKAKKFLPDNEELLRLLAICNITLGQPEEAVSILNSLVKSCPKKGKYRFELGRAYYMMSGEGTEPKLYDKSLKNFQKAIELDPDTDLYYRALNFARNKTKINEWDFNKVEEKEETKENRHVQIKNKHEINNETTLVKDVSHTYVSPSLIKSLQDLEKHPSYQALSNMVGMDSVQSQIREITASILFKQNRKGNSTSKPVAHTIFAGPPGTGKTTVARLYGDIFKAMGYLSKGHLVEANRQDLVGQYIGHTEKHTLDKIKEAMGGVLFIDEAYSLSPKDKSTNDFGQMAINTLVAEMENRRDDLIIIAAGYRSEMEDFLNSNPGLRSRFPNRLNFPDYNPDELYQIFELHLNQENYQVKPSARPLVIEMFQSLYEARDENFGNARTVRIVFQEFDKAVSLRQATTGKFTDAVILEEDVVTVKSKLQEIIF